jgi:hypothetical protein
MRIRFRVLAVAVASFVAAGCASVSSPTGTSADPALDESRLPEPPAEWRSGVAFQFEDSTVLPQWRFSMSFRFHDGVRRRTVTAADYFASLSGGPRTPWYRLRPEGLDTIVVPIEVTVEHAGGGRTTAIYPLPISKDEFFDVYAGIGKRQPVRDDGPPPLPGSRGYPLDKGSGAPPTDSLWISYSARGRYCFGCPR